MLRIGCHLSSSKGFFHMGKEAVKLERIPFSFSPEIQEEAERKK